MFGQQGKGDGNSEGQSDPKNPFLNGTGKYPSFNGTGKLPALNGTSKLSALNSNTGRVPALDLTGKQRGIPQRPPGMTRLNTPPEMPRVPRPQKPGEGGKLPRSKRLLVVLGSFLAIVVVIAIVIGVFLVQAINASSGPAAAASDFLNAVSTQNYTQAYQDLGPAITIPTSPQQFTQMATSMDRCYGNVTNYAEVANSAKTQNNVQTFTYTITRSKLAKTYELHLRIQQDSEDQTWKIIDYGNNLGPTQATTSCK